MIIAVFLKRLHQTPRNRVHQKSFRGPLFGALICLFAALTFLSMYGHPAWAQKASGQQERSVVSPPSSTPGPIDLDRYFAEGYSIHGPAALDSVSARVLVFPGRHGQKGLAISLANKAVVVMDAAGNLRSFSALGPGVSGILCVTDLTGSSSTS